MVGCRRAIVSTACNGCGKRSWPLSTRRARPGLSRPTRNMIDETAAFLLASTAMVALWVRIAPQTNTKAYYMTVGAVYTLLVPIAYPYFDFYTSRPGFTPIVPHFAVIAAILVTILPTLFPPVRRLREPAAVAMVVAGIAGLLIHWTVGNPIKRVLADAAGVFDAADPLVGERPILERSRFVSREGGYALTVPSTWERKTAKVWNLTYFSRSLGDARAELRPGCNHHSATPLAVSQQRERTNGNSVSCYTWLGVFRACLVKEQTTIHGERVERWLWDAEHKMRPQVIQLTFVVRRPRKGLEEEMRDIIKSVDPLASPVVLPLCLGVREWLAM